MFLPSLLFLQIFKIKYILHPILNFVIFPYDISSVILVQNSCTHYKIMICKVKNSYAIIKFEIHNSFPLNTIHQHMFALKIYSPKN